MTHHKHLSHKKKGNIATVLFGAVAMVGVVSAATMQIITGPLRTATQVNNKNMAESQMISAAQVMIVDVVNLANEGDVDSDGDIEPREYDTWAGGPTGGGAIPAAVGAAKVDPWGTQYGYCVWDHGSVDNGKNDAGTGTDNRLQGPASDQSAPVIAILSAGANKTFEYSCAAYDGSGNEGVVTASPSDDLVVTYAYTEAGTTMGGLWNLKAGSPTVAEIDKQVEIRAEDDSVAASIDRTGVGVFSALTTDQIVARTGNTLSVQASSGTSYNGNVTLGAFANPRLWLNNNAGTASTIGLGADSGAGWVGTTTDSPFSILTNNVARMHVTNDGNIGIGTDNPAQALDVSGDIAIEGQRIASRDTGANITYLGSVDTGDEVRIRTNGTDKVTFTQDGNVGLGITTPLTKLHIRDNNPTIRLEDNAGAPASTWDIRNQDGTLSFLDGSDNRMMIDTAGDILVSRDDAAPIVQITNTTSSSSRYPGLNITNHTGGTDGSPIINFFNAGGTEASRAALSSGNALGLMSFSGHDGSSFYQLGRIGVFAESNFSGTSTPTYMQFSTSAPNDASSWRPIERMRITSSGNVGIGTEAPQNRLHLHRSDGSANNIQFTNADSGSGTPSSGFRVGIGSDERGYMYHGNNEGLAFGTNNTERMTITADGNVGIGTTDPDKDLQVEGENGARIVRHDTGNGNTSKQVLALHRQYEGGAGATGIGAHMDFLVETTTEGDVDPIGRIKFETTNATAGAVNSDLVISNFSSGNRNDDYFVMKSNGNIGIGTASPAELLDVNGNVQAVAYLYSSDRNLKTNVSTLPNALDHITQLEGVSFDWINDERANENGRQIGLIAQDVAKVYPELVRGEDGEMSVNYAALVAPLIESVKELKAQNEELSARLDAAGVPQNRDTMLWVLILLIGIQGVGLIILARK